MIFEYSELTEKFEEYEISHQVETYTTQGLNIWPCLRAYAFFNIFLNQAENSEKISGKVRSDKYNPVDFQTLKAKLKDWENNASLSSRYHFAFVTYSQHRKLVNGQNYDIFADSIADLSKQKVLVLEEAERGRYFIPRAKPSYLLGQKLKTLSQLNVIKNIFVFRYPEPWMSEFSRWYNEISGQSFNIAAFNRYVSNLLTMKNWFKRIFKKTKVKAVFLNCWYLHTNLAAAQAAHELGLASIDFQHGIPMFTYGWHKAPPERYGMMPDYFWVWGQRDKDFLLSSNKNIISDSRIIIGGNLWLNQWKAKNVDDQELNNAVNCYEKVILVTTEKLEWICPDIKPLVEQGDKRWLWLIRLHPAFSDKIEQVQQLFKSYSNVNVKTATNKPMYALFKLVDIHLTWRSTCALEALAFGKCSILLHEDGKKSYNDLIERKLMHYCATPKDVLNTICTAPKILESACELIFANNQTSEQALNYINTISS